MTENIDPIEKTDNLTTQDKVISLFKFIEELNKLKQKIIYNIKDNLWYKTISNLPNDPDNITVNYRDRVEEENAETATDTLLSIHKPEYTNCPEPDQIFSEWLEPGWERFNNETISLKAYLEKDYGKVVDEREKFTDNSTRVSEFEKWKVARESWRTKELIRDKTRDCFLELYNIYVNLQRENETLELIVADGFIMHRDDKGLTHTKTNHPMITRRVKIRLDDDDNTIYIEDVDVEPEIYTDIFQDMNDINFDAIKYMSQILRKEDYHPLDRNEFPDFLKAFSYRLSGESLFLNNAEIPQDWQSKAKILIYQNPCFILRKRSDGVNKSVEQIIENIAETGYVPVTLRDIVEGGEIEVSEDVNEVTIEEQLAAVGGESVDILLSKEANKEQLEIAKRLERYNAVLVQGPPGTGKTHTIANLMGHFLAQGKSVLVTSHTQKALSVLKDKVVEGLQNLCVSVLEDSNVDMERSIDGITNYMSRYTSFELEKEKNELESERKQVIEDLADTRKKIFAIINQESNCIVYNGEEISPSAAAAFVQENIETLSYIPGKVHMYEPLPLSFSELTELYRSNENISADDEQEFVNNLPNPEEIISPENFEEACKKISDAKEEIKTISTNNEWTIENQVSEHKVSIDMPDGQLNLNYDDTEHIENLKQYVLSFETAETWMQHCAVDGKKGENYRQIWLMLIDQIKTTCSLADELVKDKFGKEIIINNKDADFINAVKQLQAKFEQKGKVGKLDLMFNKKLEVALNGATINGASPQNADDCNLLIKTIEFENEKTKCASYWNELMKKYGVPEFMELDTTEQERIAFKYIPLIERYLDWYEKDYSILTGYMKLLGIDSSIVFQENTLDSEIVVTQKILHAINRVIPHICNIMQDALVIATTEAELEVTKNNLSEGKRINSSICKNLIEIINSGDVASYQNSFRYLEETYAKEDIIRKREAYLKRLQPVAPEWADAIRDRVGLHGKFTVPSDIDDAWKWKQYYEIIEDITSEPFADLQNKSVMLSKRYREITAKFAEKSAWYHLLHRTEHNIDMKQALIGWKQTVKKIGKGTGKNAPKYRAEARRLMAKCQNAVPAWIMPIGKALETLNPKVNNFDVIIVDEASQSDISSLAILYMGKKLVIVGDDKQVSPLAVGIPIEKINALKDMYISGKIPNAHLYDPKTSIYDIAATTFQPLMLREHFRCVPEIIGFSNWLSYDFKIKPLRDCSNSVLLPAVVNYRVANGERIGKTNRAEAQNIVALIQACIEQPEYEGKTFGIISMLADEQVKVIQEELYLKIDAKEYTKRRILCGNASNFQGDERDVIFLSMVDSPKDNGPLALKGYGADDSIRKRYNVAASRAKDQLWVVDSLDSATDLKSGDIRKKLIDYSLNPDSVNILNERIEKESESPFEMAVAKTLAAKGYHLVQQWKVGAYRIDMVVVCGLKKVAIECDGERYHSGEIKIREDMERQTILERLGWQFIRIRGSEYYRDTDKTMEHVIKRLEEFNIYPEDTTLINGAVSNEPQNRDTELLNRVKRRAYEILQGKDLDKTFDIKDNDRDLHFGELSMNTTVSKDENTTFDNAEEFEHDKQTSSQKKN